MERHSPTKRADHTDFEANTHANPYGLNEALPRYQAATIPLGEPIASESGRWIDAFVAGVFLSAYSYIDLENRRFILSWFCEVFGCVRMAGALRTSSNLDVIAAIQGGVYLLLAIVVGVLRSVRESHVRWSEIRL